MAPEVQKTVCCLVTGGMPTQRSLSNINASRESSTCSRARKLHAALWTPVCAEGRLPATKPCTMAAAQLLAPDLQTRCYRFGARRGRAGQLWCTQPRERHGRSGLRLTRQSAAPKTMPSRSASASNGGVEQADMKKPRLAGLSRMLRGPLWTTQHIWMAGGRLPDHAG